MVRLCTSVNSEDNLLTKIEPLEKVFYVNADNFIVISPFININTIENGKVFSWGDGKKGQLGHGSKELAIQPSPEHGKIKFHYLIVFTTPYLRCHHTHTHAHTHTHTHTHTNTQTMDQVARVAP